MDKELLTTVFEDLEYITEEWNKQDVSDANLRRSSSTLRRLIIYGDLFKAARLFGMKELRALTSNEEYSSLSGSIFHQAGGGKHNETQIKSFSIYDKKLTPEEIQLLYKTNKQKKSKLINLHKFMKRPSFTIQGTEINREEVIKYVCNKLGGAHYDTTRKKDDEKEKKYSLLDEHANSKKLMGKKAVYFELLRHWAKTCK